MSKNTYNISLKGYVGGLDFDRATVDRELARNADKQVNVLIDSLGGSLATGLSISAAFKNHGKVNVHFVGLNASAATIASLGAAHISIDAGAMYLVHQCSMEFFEWGCLNSAQFDSVIADCEKIKADLDKLDLNCTRMYAARCKRKPEDLLALMKVGGWLSAQEALDWGFVDEITDLEDEKAPELTDALASAMANAGMPIPPIPVSGVGKDSAFAKFLYALTSFFRPNASVSNSINTVMKKSYSLLCAVIGLEAVELTDNKASLSDEQLSALEDHIAGLGKKIEDRDRSVAEKEALIADLQAMLDAKPADGSIQVVDDAGKGKPEPKNNVERFVESYNSARELFNEV